MDADTMNGAEPVGSRGDMAATLARLALLDPIKYDRVRKAEAEALGIRTRILDEQVAALRPKRSASDSRTVTLPEVEPWLEPVDTAVLLDELATTIRRHVVMSDASVDCTALWIAHTWIYECFQHSPRLSITSPAKRCGKSTLLELLRTTCYRPLKADNISASGVFRTVELLRPLTLLVDEADTFLSNNEELRGVLNSGFERSGEVVRVVEVKGELQPVCFATFAPVAVAGIGKLPGTLEDRAVPIVLQRKSAGEMVMKLRSPGVRAGLHDLARKLGRWAADRGPQLPQDPAVPETMGDREGDVAVPLLAIADDAGGEWPKRARRALLEVFGRRVEGEGTMEAGTLLLADVRSLFLGMSATRLASAEIVKRLAEMEERPWPEWKAGKPMTAPQLAQALAPFGVRPTTIRTGRETAKGYYREAFEEAWSRYLPSDTTLPAREQGPEPSHRHMPGNSRASGENGTVTDIAVLRGENRGKAAENLDCDGVTAAVPLPWENVDEAGSMVEVDL